MSKDSKKKDETQVPTENPVVGSTESPQEPTQPETPIIPDATPDDTPPPATNPDAPVSNPADTTALPSENPPIVQPPNPTSEATVRQHAQERIDALQQEVIGLGNEREQLQAKINEKKHEIASLSPYIIQKVDPQQNQKNILSYIKDQNKVRSENAAKRQAVIGTLALHEVIPQKGSKLDQAFQSKRGRGLKRPTYPVIAG